MVEIEKCRNDIKKLREEMVSRNNRCLRNNKTSRIKTPASVSPALIMLLERKCYCDYFFHFQQLPGGQ